MSNAVDADPADAVSVRRQRVDIGRDRTGAAREIEVYSFGVAGARPKAYLQTALHADELPGMLVMRRLLADLTMLAERGDVIGEIVVVPVANPIGLAQREGDYMQGRVERGTDRNFNRGFPDLAGLVKKKIEDKLGDDASENVAIIRKAMRKALSKIEPADAFETLQLTLIKNACDADIVLDLHADNEALVHLYTGKKLWPEAADLAAEIDARAVILCDYAGDAPFDEACGGPWWTLPDAFPSHPIPQACLSATLELRSNNDVSSAFADRDARAILRFLTRRGCLKGEAGSLPRLLGRAMPLDEMHRLKASIEGVIDYKLKLGDTVRAGDAVAEVIPAVGGTETVVAPVSGLLFARHDQTWAWPGKTIGKIAGEASAQGD
ncbi:MAG: succinylglutamate desuccinylase/aspartoacylase family protein [Pseudomonadota bacterium]